ncbi:MAG: tRNA (adenine(22)-N(1))-methyltransferase TrmK, partial [Veillonella sp.]|nr:tRNA (adenine(22)-N(1))-methyltransferase TrmK [Veillonella sp.]
MKLSKRLAAAYDMVPNARCIADVGTDHGYLAAALLQGGKADYVIAIDVNKGPLATA